MAEEKKSVLWAADEKELLGLTPLKARDLVIRCLCEYQRETFVRTKQKLGNTVNDEEIRKSAAGIVRMIFQEIGGDYNLPTRGALAQVIDSLSTKVKGWGTAPEIVELHRAQMQRILGKLA